VGLERGPLSFVSTTEELLERKGSGSGLEIRDHGRGDPLRWPCDTLYPQTLALTSPTSGGLSVGIVRSLQSSDSSYACANTVITTCPDRLQCQFPSGVANKGDFLPRTKRLKSPADCSPSATEHMKELYLHYSYVPLRNDSFNLIVIQLRLQFYHHSSSLCIDVSMTASHTLRASNSPWSS
jgi:hypothetical protein